MDSINKNMKVICGDATLGLHGENFSYLFSYAHGGPESFCIKGNEWLYRVPKPTFWRATTDNDRGNKFPYRCGMWLGADMFLPCIDINVYMDGTLLGFPISPKNNVFSDSTYAHGVKIVFTYETITTPSTKVIVAYTIRENGDIKVSVDYIGNNLLPELPVFGLRFVAPTKAVAYRYEGLSGETYPDRMAGGVNGIYNVEGLPLTKYLVPQDCNVHMNTTWLEVFRNTTLHSSKKDLETFGIKFTALDKNFAFSCIPYTSQELENATHHEELPPARRTVISILGAVRGVGGIDSWGSNVEERYRIDSGKDIHFSFLISGIF